MATPSPPVHIRPARPEDVPAIAELVNAFAAQDLMLPRSPESIQASLANWLVAEAAGTGSSTPAFLGCGSLVALTEELAEIRSLAVHPRGQGQGVGSQIVRALVDLARQRGFRQVCALTLREQFFERLGFAVVDRWSVSPKLWQECIYCPKFHRCDEVAVLMNLDGRPVEATQADPTRSAAWQPLLRWQAWQPLRLAYQERPPRAHRAADPGEAAKGEQAEEDEAEQA